MVVGLAGFSRVFSVFLVVSTFAAVSAIAAPPPVEAFGKREQISDLSMSPDGKRYAALQWIKGEEVLIVFDMFAQDPGQRVRKLSLDASRRLEEKVESVYWLNNNTIALVFMFEDVRWGSLSGETRLLAVNTDLTRMWPLPKPVKEARYNSQLQHNVIDFLDDDPEHILMAFDRRGYGGTLNVYRVTISTGGVEQLTLGGAKVAGYQTDQQGRVRLRWSYPSGKAQVHFRTPDHDRWHILFEKQRNETFDMWPEAFGKDPNRLLMGHTATNGFDELLEFDLSTKSVVAKIFSRPNADVTGVAEDRYTRAVIGYYFEDEYSKIHYTDSELSNLQKSIDKALPGTQNHITSYDRHRSMFVVLSSGPKNSGTYYIYLKAQRQLIKVLDRMSIAVDAADLGDMKAITFEARDGTKIPAYLTTPPRGKAPYPLIVMPHGGPTSRDYLTWDHWVQFLASRGYAVLQPNFRGSSGFGASHQVAGYGQWGLLMQDDVTDGAKAMVKLGFADPERMCIVGGSYGGYAALMGAVKTPNLFQCAISFAGVTDILRILAEGKKFKFATNNPPNVGGWRDDRDQLHDTSPINNIDAIKIPILLIHGDKDLSVRVSHSRRMAAALKRAKKPHKLVILKDGNHHLQLERHRLRFLQEMEAFLAQHIGP